MSLSWEQNGEFGLDVRTLVVLALNTSILPAILYVLALYDLIGGRTLKLKQQTTLISYI